MPAALSAGRQSRWRRPRPRPGQRGGREAAQRPRRSGEQGAPRVPRGALQQPQAATGQPGHGERRRERPRGAQQPRVAARGDGRARLLTQHLLDRCREHHVVAVLANAFGDGAGCGRRRRIGEPEKPGPTPLASTAGPDTRTRIRGPVSPVSPAITSRTSTPKEEISVPRITDSPVQLIPAAPRPAGRSGRRHARWARRPGSGRRGRGPGEPRRRRVA